MMDTGADRTLISPRALAAAGVSLSRPVGTGQMHGVTGSDRMDFVIVNSIEIGDARVGRMPVASYEMPHARGDGLRSEERRVGKECRSRWAQCRCSEKTA